MLNLDQICGDPKVKLEKWYFALVIKIMFPTEPSITGVDCHENDLRFKLVFLIITRFPLHTHTCLMFTTWDGQSRKSLLDLLDIWISRSRAARVVGGGRGFLFQEAVEGWGWGTIGQGWDWGTTMVLNLKPVGGKSGPAWKGLGEGNLIRGKLKTRNHRIKARKMIFWQAIETWQTFKLWENLGKQAQGLQPALQQERPKKDLPVPKIPR